MHRPRRTTCWFRPVDIDSLPGPDDYCYANESCDGDQMSTAAGDLLMTKEICCGSVGGTSWGSVDQCTACDAQNAPYLPVHSSSK